MEEGKTRRSLTGSILGAVLGAVSVFLIGFGGGNKGGFQSRQDSFSVGANEGADKTFGEFGFMFEAGGRIFIT